MSIAVGQTAPDFTLMNQEKKEVKLSDFAGKKNVVLVFYPLDWSPTCTNEHACFVNDMRSFDTLDAEVLGVSYYFCCAGCRTSRSRARCRRARGSRGRRRRTSATISLSRWRWKAG